MLYNADIRRLCIKDSDNIYFTCGSPLSLLPSCISLCTHLSSQRRRSKAKTGGSFLARNLAAKVIAHRICKLNGLNPSAMSIDAIYGFALEGGALGINRVGLGDALGEKVKPQVDGWRRCYLSDCRGKLHEITNLNIYSQRKFFDLYNQFIEVYLKYGQLLLCYTKDPHGKALCDAILEIIGLSPDCISINHLHALLLGQDSGQAPLLLLLNKEIKSDASSLTDKPVSLAQLQVEWSEKLREAQLPVELLQLPFDAFVNYMKVLDKSHKEKEAKTPEGKQKKQFRDSLKFMLEARGLPVPEQLKGNGVKPR